MADALLEAAEVVIGGIKRMLRVSYFVIPPLDIARFLAVQETDDQLVYRRVPVIIGRISFIAKIGIERLFPRDLEGPVQHFGELGVAFWFGPFLFLVGL